MTPSTLQAAIDYTGSWLALRSRQVDIPGFCVAIYYEDSLVFSRAFGYANLERSEALRIDHIFGMASQSKMFTATAILQLVAVGKLRLDDEVIIHLPWLSTHRDQRMHEITVRQLLSHSSGLLRDGLDSGFWELRRSFPNANGLQRAVLGADIVTEPSMSVKYSNLGYALLGQVIQVASGQTSQAYLRDHIIKPLGLHNTFTDFSSRIAPRVATGYGLSYDNERQALEPRPLSRTLSSAVGVHATVEDMCRFAASYFFDNETILGNRFKKEGMRTQSLVTNGWDAGLEFGLGFRLQSLPFYRLAGHDGHLLGHLSATFFDPFKRIAVAIAANAQDAPGVQMINGIFEVLDWFTHNVSVATPPRLTRFNAKLRSDNSSVDIIATKDRLAAVDPASWSPFARPETLMPIDAKSLHIVTPGNFEQPGELVTYTFDKDVVRAVNYAGLTMLPITGYYGRPLENVPTVGSEHCLALEDIATAQLRIGRVLKVESCRSRLPYRLLVHFTPGIIRYCYLPQLPRNIRKNELVGKQVLGAVFKVWHFGKIKYEVVALGVSVSHRVGVTLASGDLLALMPDPAYPRTLGANFVKGKGLTAHFSQALRSSFFKIEAQPEYFPEEVIYYGDSLAAWKKGQFNYARALINKQPNPEVIRIPKEVRLLLVDDNLSSFQRWSLEVKKKVNVPSGCLIYTLPRKHVRNLPLPEGDFAIWDENRVTVNGYRDLHWTHVNLYDKKNGNNIHKFLKLEHTLMRLAVKYGTKL